MREPSQSLTTRGSSSTCASQAPRESPASIGSQIAYTVSFACGWASRMCVRTQLAPSAQTLQVGERSRIRRGSCERVLNSERSWPTSLRSVNCRGPRTPLVVDSAADVDGWCFGAAAALPEAGEHCKCDDRAGGDKDQRAVAVGEVAGPSREADTEADDRVVGDGRGVAEPESCPVVEEVAAGGE